MCTKFKRIKYVIVDRKDKEISSTYSYNRAIHFVQCVCRQCGAGKILWYENDNYIKEEIFFNNKE